MLQGFVTDLDIYQFNHIMHGLSYRVVLR